MQSAQLRMTADRDKLKNYTSKGAPSKRYVPPAEPLEEMLSYTLRNTDRFPERKQMSFLERQSEDQTIADMKLFYSGNLALLDRPCVAIVGTRQVSDEGRRRTIRLAKALVKEGVVIVSGLAYGVDAVAHRTAIECGGSTIAVIGTPLNKASPSENADLQEQIYRDHLLISQFPEGGQTYRTNFPLRNKLMATLSDATVVMEASNTSGTLHQAAACTKLGRWLFITRSAVNDKSLSWPQKFLKYDTCVPLDDVSDILSRILPTK